MRALQENTTANASKTPTTKLFSPIRVSGLTLKNRVIMPAMILNYPIVGYELSEEWTQFYARRARGGPGLIIVGACYVDQAGKMDPHQLGADRDEWLPALSGIARAIKGGGSIPALQLNHAGRYAKKSITGIEPVAPSPIVSRYTKEVPRELSVEEIEEITTAFAAAARRGQIAGYEAIELLGASGYLISEFLSPLTNHRTDRFGGSEEKRRTFVRELIAAIKREVGNDFPLIFRQSSTDNLPGGMDAEDQFRLALELEKWGVHLLNLTAGWHDASVPQITPAVAPGHFVPYAERIHKAVSIPVACAVRITTPELARRVVDEDRVDMVTLARALIADPDWPMKAEAGDDDAIRYCIACCDCFDSAFAREKIVCSINAALVDDTPRPAARVKRILVVGAGPAGMEAARVLARRGHRVTLVEKSEQLGGKLFNAARPPYKSELHGLIRFLVHEVTSLKVQVVKTVDYTSLAKSYDGVILATGAEERVIKFKGNENLPTYMSSQVLEDKVSLEGPVVIVGAGEVGCETADHLSFKGIAANIVEIQPRPAPEMGATLRWVLLHRLKEAGVKLLLSSSVKEIREGEVVVQSGETTLSLKAKALVLAVGFQPVESEATTAVRASGLPYCEIGDRKSARRIQDAIHEGYEAATAWVDELR